MGSGSNTTTQSSSSEPWSGQQPALKKGLAGAENLYDAGIGQQVYEGSTVIPFADQTTQGFNAIEGNAAANMNGQGLSGQYQGIIDNGGYNAAQQGAMSQMQQAASGYQNDPTYQAYRQNTLNDVSNSVNEAMSGAGRYGSAAHTGALADQLSAAGSQMDMQQLSRQDAANQNLFNMGQAGQGNLATAYAGMGQPAQDLMQVGGAYEDLATRTKNDELRIFDEAQNKPWENLGRLNAVATGAGNYGSSTTTAQGPSANPFMQAAGAGLSLAGLFGGF
jgi:hypothetical protein